MAWTSDRTLPPLPVYGSEAAYITAKAQVSTSGTYSLEDGDAYFDSTTNSLKIYSGTEWEEYASASSITGDVSVDSDGVATVTDLTIASEADKDILVFDGSGWEAVDVSGDATIANTGALTVTDVTVGSDATGDLLYKSSATALARLGIGSAGDVLTVNSGGTLAVWSGKTKKYTKFNGSHVLPVCSRNLGGAASGADQTYTHCNLGYDLPPMLIYNHGTNTTRIAPRPVVDANCTDGLELPSTNADNVGCTLSFGGSLLSLNAQPTAPTCFTVGTDAAFYMQCKLGIPDVSDYDALFIGFVEPAAGYIAITDAATLIAAYDEKAGFAVNEGDIFTYTSLAGSDVATDLTETDWADDGVHTLKILVSAAGVVTYEFDGSAAGGAVAFSFAPTTVVTPVIIAVKNASAAADTPPIIETLEWGLQ